jgi:hypothetical protein
LHGSQADVQIEQLPQGNVKGTNAASNRSRKRAFNSDKVFLEGGDGVFGQPVVEPILCGLAGEDFKPEDFASTFVGFLNGSVKDPFAGSPNVWTCAIASNEGDYGIVWTLDDAIVSRDFTSSGRPNVFVCHSAAPREEGIKNKNTASSQSVILKTL